MKRRAILFASGAWLAAAAARSFAQTSKAPRRIAFVHPGTQASYQSLFDIFRTALRKLGYIESRDIAIDALWAEGRTDHLPSLAAQAVALKPAVIVTATTAGVAACKKATSSIPIVFATAFNPVEQGFVSSLRRPGGNVTGIMVHSDLAAKVLEVTRDAFPKARRLAVLVHDIDPAHKFVLDNFVPNAQRFNFEPQVVRVAQVEHLDRAFKELTDRRADALYVPQLAFMTSYRSQIIERTLKARLPLLSNVQETTAAGGLLSYGTRSEENWRRAAALVDKILRGAKPGDLPVEQPERFEMVVNMKTANAIGVSLSPLFLQRADKVIE